MTSFFYNKNSIPNFSLKKLGKNMIIKLFVNMLGFRDQLFYEILEFVNETSLKWYMLKDPEDYQMDTYIS